jgi:hypothetical protein
VRKSLRLMGSSPKPRTTIYHIVLERGCVVQDSKINSPMSALGQQQT